MLGKALVGLGSTGATWGLFCVSAALSSVKETGGG